MSFSPIGSNADAYLVSNSLKSQVVINFDSKLGLLKINAIKLAFAAVALSFAAVATSPMTSLLLFGSAAYALYDGTNHFDTASFKGSLSFGFNSLDMIFSKAYSLRSGIEMLGKGICNLMKQYA